MGTRYMADSSKPSRNVAPADTSRIAKPLRPANSHSGETARAADSVPATVGPFATLPTQFGRYEIRKELGRGQMGAVFLAYDVELDRLVALKVARTSASGSAKLLKRMAIEARSAAKVDHPQICKVYDAGEIDGIRFIALQYIEGEDLKQYLKRKGRKREPEEAVRLILQILRALEAAHEQGVIHRDLKPENVMLNKKNQPVIMDFGLARTTIASSNAGLTQGMIVGTAAYMSPEQATGNAEEIDHRSDLYAVGVMLFEMLTGEWPFTGGSIEVMGKKSVQEPPSPLTLVPDLNPTLAETCLKLIAKKKEARFFNCTEAIEALKAINLNATSTAISAPLSADAIPLNLPTPTINKSSPFDTAMQPPGLVEAGTRLRRTRQNPRPLTPPTGDKIPLTDVGFSANRTWIWAITSLVAVGLIVFFTARFHDPVTSSSLQSKVASPAEDSPTPEKQPVANVAKIPSPANDESSTMSSVEERSKPVKVTPPVRVKLSDLDRVATGHWVRLVDSNTKLSNPQKMNFANGVLELVDVRMEFRDIRARDIIVRAEVQKVSGQNVNIWLRSGTKGLSGWYNGQQDGTDLFGIGIWNPPWKDLASAHIQKHFSSDQFVEMAFASLGKTLSLYVEGKRAVTVQSQELNEGFICLGAVRGKSRFKNVEYQILDQVPIALPSAETKTALTPAEAAKSIDEFVVVEMEVKSSGGNGNHYLNSEEDYKDPKNFTIFISKDHLDRFRGAGINDPINYYKTKFIQVKGTVVIEKGAPWIKVDDPGQIKIVNRNTK
jgi:serine/threonine protein kinase